MVNGYPEFTGNKKLSVRHPETWGPWYILLHVSCCSDHSYSVHRLTPVKKETQVVRCSMGAAVRGAVHVREVPAGLGGFDGDDTQTTQDDGPWERILERVGLEEKMP